MLPHELPKPLDVGIGGAFRQRTDTKVLPIPTSNTYASLVMKYLARGVPAYFFPIN
jgi:hypothetical protein